MAADVAQAERAEQGVGEGVGDHVRIRVAVQPQLEVDGNPAENQLAAGNQPVGVETVTDAHGQCLPQQGRGHLQVAGPGYFQVALAALDHLHRDTGRLEQGRLVGADQAGAVGLGRGPCEQVPLRALGGLRLPEAAAVHGADDASGRVDLLEGVRDRNRGNGRAEEVGGLQAAFDGGPVNERPGRVVDKDETDVRRQLPQAGPDRVLAGGAAHGDAQPRHRVRVEVKREQGKRRLPVGGRHRHHHQADGRHLEKGAAGADQDRRAGQVEELLGGGVAEAGTAAAGRDDDPGRRRMDCVCCHGKKRGVSYKPNSVPARRRAMII